MNDVLYVCLHCDEPAVTKNHCEKHRQALNEYTRRRIAKRKGKNPDERRPSSCRRCWKPGHNARTCREESP